MKFLFDYFPIICFFIVYKFYGIYAATASTMAACAIQNGLYYMKHRRFEKMHLITLVLVLVLGSFTLFLHDEIFIKWKPSVIYWIFSIVLLYSQYFSHKNLMERMLGDKIALPALIWERINWLWAGFFLVLGFINLYVVYHYTTNAWVNFKLFGTLGLTLVLIIGQAIYMARYIEPSDDSKNQP